MPRGDGPFQVPKRINDNAYELDMLDTFLGSHTFNISDLTPFFCRSSEFVVEFSPTRGV